MDTGPRPLQYLSYLSYRSARFDVLRSAVINALSKYIEDTNNRGWSARAQALIDEILSWESTFERPRFLELHNRIRAFAESCTSVAYYTASFFVSEEALQERGYGSLLKKQILSLLERYDPYTYDCIANEIIIGRNKRIFTRKNYGRLEDEEELLMCLSEESRHILNLALSDEAILLKLNTHADCPNDQANLQTLIEQQRAHQSKDSSWLSFLPF